jgi:hypothetical protein
MRETQRIVFPMDLNAPSELENMRTHAIRDGNPDSTH